MITDIQTLVDDRVRAPTGKVSTLQRDRAIATAVVQYSRDRPRLVFEDVDADGGNELPLPSAWVPAISTLQSIETPIGSTPPSLLDSNEFAVVGTPDGDVIRVLYSLNAGTTVRLAYTSRHLLDASHETFPLEDREAVVLWAAAILCDQVSSALASNSEPTIRADSVDFQNPSREFAKRAEAYRKLYAGMLGVAGLTTGAGQAAGGPTKAAGTVVQFDLPTSRNRRMSRPQR